MELQPRFQPLTPEINLFMKGPLCVRGRPIAGGYVVLLDS
jgi:hypothetical protein